jgi:hypothetical protein
MRFSGFLPLAAAAFLAVACSGQAQQTDTALREAEDGELIVEPFDLTIEDIEEDADLLGPSGEEVGAIEAVLVDAGGRPAAITAEVGSFVGTDEKTVVIGLDRLQVNADGDLVTVLTGEELQRLPAWEG